MSMPVLGGGRSDGQNGARGRWSAAGVAAIALLAAGVIGWSIGQSGGANTTRTVTHTATVPASSPTVYQDTQAGAVAAVQAALAQFGSQPPLRPARGTHPGPGQVDTNWNLLYRVKSYTPAHAVVTTWRFSFAAGYGFTLQGWTFLNTTVVWHGGQWALDGSPTIVADGTPPAVNTTGARDQAFGALLSQFRRFPGAP